MGKTFEKAFWGTVIAGGGAVLLSALFNIDLGI